MFYNNIPTIDLHGETKDTSRLLVREFINDNYKLKYKKVLIIHGIGEGILKKEVHKILKDNKLVKNFYLDNFNIGCTVVELFDTVDK